MRADQLGRRAVTALVAVAVLAAACGGDGLDLTAEERQLIAQSGWNQTGRLDLTEDDWVEIVERGCDEGAWETDVQAAIVADWELDRNVPMVDAMVAVFTTTLLACRDDVPADILGE